MSDEDYLPNITPEFVSVREAAKMLGVSERSVYGYIEERKLPGFKATNLTVVALKDVHAFKRGTTGRPRTRVPEWRISDNENVQYLTQVFIQIRNGQKEELLRRLEEIRKGNMHTFPGTVARYFAQSQTDDNALQILLVWRGTVMPDEEIRSSALADLKENLADLLEWDSAHVEMHEVLMHT
jgi:excisionase family DNA binding protein